MCVSGCVNKSLALINTIGLSVSVKNDKCGIEFLPLTELGAAVLYVGESDIESTTYIKRMKQKQQIIYIKLG